MHDPGAVGVYPRRDGNSVAVNHAPAERRAVITFTIA
jgi:hypothetical protein